MNYMYTYPSKTDTVKTSIEAIYAFIGTQCKTKIRTFKRLGKNYKKWIFERKKKFLYPTHLSKIADLSTRDPSWLCLQIPCGTSYTIVYSIKFISDDNFV
jgi:hypothetical protein